MTLAFYNDKLQSIRPDKSSGRAKPHKVCMMFAVMDLIEQGNDADSPFLPFYHLKSSRLWHLDVSSENKPAFDSIKSATDANLRKLVNFAFLDEALFDYLKSPSTASILRNALTANLDTLEDQYGRWAKSIGKSDKIIKNYVGALKNSIPNWLSDAGVTKQSLLSVGSFQSIMDTEHATYGWFIKQGGY